jgi:hypothetical protein
MKYRSTAIPRKKLTMPKKITTQNLQIKPQVVLGLKMGIATPLLVDEYVKYS